MCAGTGTSLSSILSVKLLQPFRKISQTAVRISTAIPDCIFDFWVLVGGTSLLDATSSLRSGLEDELDESCGGDVEGETLPELAENLGTSSGAKLSVLHIIVFSSGQPWFFDR